jgi:hypothetical protein
LASALVMGGSAAASIAVAAASTHLLAKRS